MKSHHATHAARHSAVSIVLHWATALLVIAIYALALAPGVIKGSIALHGALGIVLLALVVVRIGWRIAEGRTVNAGASGAQRLMARASHVALYILLVAVPVLGLFYVDAKGIPFSFFGTTLPLFAYYSRELAQTVYAVKTGLAYGLLALIFLHAAAAILYHHLLRRDGVLRSMVLSPVTPPERQPSPAAGLATAR